MEAAQLGPAASGAGDIQVIARSAQLLRLFSSTKRTLRVSDVGPESGLQRTTVHRYMSSMANAGLLERDNDGGYRLGPLLVQLGTVALRGLRVLEIAGPHCQELADEANETAVIAVWGGLGPIVARVHEATDRLVNISIRIGSQLPLEAAQSVVFLAFMPDVSIESRLLSQLPETRKREIRNEIDTVRRDGYMVSSQVVQGIRAIAAPVFDGRGDICATVAILGTVNGISDGERSGLLLALARTAERLSRNLGWTGNLPFNALLESNQSAS